MARSLFEISLGSGLDSASLIGFRLRSMSLEKFLIRSIFYWAFSQSSFPMLAPSPPSLENFLSFYYFSLNSRNV